MSHSDLFFDLSADLLNRGYSVRFRANGRSMHPTIKEGEAITIKPVASSDVKRGDIVLYRHHTGVIAHRVIAIEETKPDDSLVFVLRGDASGTCDKPVGSEQILGKVVCVARNGRWVALDSKQAKLFRMLRAGASRIKKWFCSGKTPVRYWPRRETNDAHRATTGS